MPERTAARSMAVVTVPPHLTSDGREWFCPAGGRDRRALRVGEHVAVDHPLALEHPTHFAASSEPPDAWPLGLPSLELRRAQEEAQRRLLPSLGRRVVPCCERCGAESPESVVLIDQPQAVVKIGLLAGIEPGPDAGAEQYRIEQAFNNRARLYQQRGQQLAAAEARFRAQHTACPEGTEPMAEPETPAELPVFHRLTSVRSNGIPRSVVGG
jgi:hypothetical protein